MSTAEPPSDSSHDAQALLALARRASDVAVELIRQRRPPGRVPVQRTKSSPTDVVTAIDQASERAIRAVLLAERPHDGFVGEEDDSVVGTSGLEWVVDPIDGTVNFVYGIPAYAVSIAARTTTGSIVGLVTNVASGVQWSAIAGQGAWRRDSVDEIRLTVPPPPEISEMLVGTGFGYRRTRREHQAIAVGHLLPQIRDIRRIGAASLDLCAVADGGLDAYVEQGLSPWDYAAGALIAVEAGAVVQGLYGQPDERLVIASHPAAAREFLELVVACGF